ncbi:uncharacterized protein LY89DRAFT_736677 [Mollisia scopiformis]|uniref:Uncharacterized protein n=1 Tax=Mollisia scopiformis TaxID=149040 RepID=A0A194X0F2_MOLSC|nr:uncharacterized protein LY89DRAFT_736677 [Mollisia scopiformis]KUJ13673.1 hypothetical protein LY89DRAFT_736677 [Mollisia scopiformis]
MAEPLPNLNPAVEDGFDSDNTSSTVTTPRGSTPTSPVLKLADAADHSTISLPESVNNHAEQGAMEANSMHSAMTQGTSTEHIASKDEPRTMNNSLERGLYMPGWGTEEDSTAASHNVEAELLAAAAQEQAFAISRSLMAHEQAMQPHPMDPIQHHPAPNWGSIQVNSYESDAPTDASFSARQHASLNELAVASSADKGNNRVEDHSTKSLYDALNTVSIACFGSRSSTDAGSGDAPVCTRPTFHNDEVIVSAQTKLAKIVNTPSSSRHSSMMNQDGACSNVESREGRQTAEKGVQATGIAAASSQANVDGVPRVNTVRYPRSSIYSGNANASSSVHAAGVECLPTSPNMSHAVPKKTMKHLMTSATSDPRLRYDVQK